MKVLNKRIQILREAVVKLTQLLAQEGVTVTQRGHRAFVKSDSRTGKPVLVNIPSIPDDATEDLIIAIQGFIDHEVAHILFSDFKMIGFLFPLTQKLNQIFGDTKRSIGVFGLGLSDAKGDTKIAPIFSGFIPITIFPLEAQPGDTATGTLLIARNEAKLKAASEVVNECAVAPAVKAETDAKQEPTGLMSVREHVRRVNELLEANDVLVEERQRARGKTIGQGIPIPVFIAIFHIRKHHNLPCVDITNIVIGELFVGWK